MTAETNAKVGAAGGVERYRRVSLRSLALLLAALAMGALFAGGPLPVLAAGDASAQAARKGAAPAAPADEEADDQPLRVVIRFLTESDYPPFNFFDEDGQLTGLNIDLARAICVDAGVACDIKERPWDELLLALKRGEADAVIAGHMVTAKALKSVDFSTPYLHTPGRFAVRRDAEKRDITPGELESQRIAVIRGSAHEAYLKAFFRGSRIEVHPSSDSAREALASGKIDYMFDDGISLSFWLNGTLSRECCEFRGGPFLESRYFGDGIAVALPKGDAKLKEVVDKALSRLRESGRLDELVGRHFPHRIY